MKTTEIFYSHRPHNQNEKQDDEDGDVQKPYLLRLPDHIIASVSCRIPIKTLMKFRHVCKSLRSLFSDPRFTTDLISRTRSCHLVSSLGSDRYFLADFSELGRPNGVAALDLSVDSATPSSAIMVGSCKGLVCLYKMHVPYGFFICNPMTGESLSLSPPIREVHCSPELPYWPLSLHQELVNVNHFEEILEPSFCGFGIGYSTLSDVYKIVLIAYSSKMRMGIRPPGEIAYGPREVMVLTVDVSGVWRHIGEFVMNNFDHTHGVYIHGCLHWTGLPVKGPRLIYVFEVESESFREIPLPRWTGSSESQMTRFNLGILNGCLSITICWTSSIHVWVMKNYGVNDSWTKELDISVDHGLFSFGGYAQILSFSPDWQLLLWQGKLQAHTTGNEGFVEVKVDGIPSSVNKAYHHVPSFISLKDVIRCQKCEGQGNVQINAADHGSAKKDEQKSNAHVLNQGCAEFITVPVDHQQQGQENVQPNAAYQRNAEADKGMQSDADLLNQVYVPSTASTITQKQQEKRSPKKVKTTHEVQPMQASACQADYTSSSEPTDPSVVQLSTANQFIHPTTLLKMKTNSPAKRKRVPA